jgi:hypothetical protein
MSLSHRFCGSEPATTDAAIASCDLEPTSWEYAPVKQHDTGVPLACLVMVAIVTVQDRLGR